ncbi:MAG TPA: metallophosphoesterase [Acetobacteraceae bacterium]|nr:metallophosphoesterase [Acetobacteraceae bacterium]
MRRPRRGARAALAATAVPTWSDASPLATTAEALRFRAAPGWLPPGRRVYAIGDVHGCKPQLAALHAAVAADLAARPIGAARLIHLGDYIDLGPDSAGVIELLAAGPPIPGAATVNLLGDHERMLLQALGGDRAAATDWLWSGGRDTLASWGIAADLPREAWEAALPATHLKFLRSLAWSHREGDYLFVHAGIRPGVALARQARDDLLTIRQPFLWTEQNLGVVVVHGHSTNPAPVVTANRIGLDTGAGNGGKLTCAVLEEDRVGFLAA